MTSSKSKEEEKSAQLLIRKDWWRTVIVKGIQESIVVEMQLVPVWVWNSMEVYG